MVTIEKQGDIHILTMQEGTGTQFDIESLAALHEVLDTIEADSEGPGALVLTGSGKAFNIGLNLASIMNYKPEQLELFSKEMPRLYSRLMNFPLPTVAAINGHAIAGGAFLALVCDYRVMREDRGWFSISEIDVGVPIPAETMAIAEKKLHPGVYRDAVLLGKKYGGKEAEELRIADASSGEEELLQTAIDLITPFSTKERGIFKTLKTNMFGEIAKNILN